MTTKLMEKGALTISRVHSQDGDYVEIRIYDDKSHIEFLTVRASLVEFANALLGSGYREIEMELRGLSSIGMTAENKEVFVKCENNDAARKKAVKALEIDGWHARQDDVTNHHRITNNGVTVVFFRLTGKPFIAQGL